MMVTLSVSSAAWAHGYIEIPESRAYKCKLGSNAQCDQAEWEPQSLEQLSGFPEKDLPKDGELASASKPSFEPLDKRRINVRALNTIQAGPQSFTWVSKTRHKTTNWRYYITKQDWAVNKPLPRESLEKEHFCMIDGQGLLPDEPVVHQCVVPERTGYQVIYGVWEIADTVNSFHSAVDVNFEEGGEQTAARAHQR